MYSLSPADELADIRAAMARLAAREAALCHLPDAREGERAARPGWPIRRAEAVQTTVSA